MPLYEYECTTCGHQFEVIRKFSDPPEEKCPKCGGFVRKLQSAPAFQFKGTGWYVTDYAKSGQSEGKTGGSDGKKDTGTEAAGKSETTSGNSTTSSASSSTPTPSGTPASKSGD